MHPTADDVLVHLRQRLPGLVGHWQPQTLLSQLPLDSIDLVELLFIVDELYGVRLTIEDYHDSRTVGALAALVARRANVEAPQP